MYRKNNVAEIANSPDDPFWLDCTDIPFCREFLNDPDDDDDDRFVFRRGIEIEVVYGEDRITLDLPEAFSVFSALKRAIEDLRKIHQQQNRYLTELSEANFKKTVDTLHDDFMKASNDADQIAKILQKLSEEPLKDPFWVRNAGVLMEQLRSSYRQIELIVALADARKRREEAKKAQEGNDA